MNVGIAMDAQFSGSKKRPGAERHLRSLAAKCDRATAGVIQLQEISPSWIEFFMSALPGRYALVPRDDDAKENYLATMYDSTQWQLESSRSYKPVAQNQTGKNFIHRRCLISNFRRPGGPGTFMAVNWHALDGKWGFGNDPLIQKERMVKRIIEECYRVETHALANAQGNNSSEFPWVITGDFNKITDRSCRKLLDELPSWSLATDGNFRDHYVTNVVPNEEVDFQFHDAMDGQHCGFHMIVPHASAPVPARGNQPSSTASASSGPFIVGGLAPLMRARPYWSFRDAVDFLQPMPRPSTPRPGEATAAAEPEPRAKIARLTPNAERLAEEVIAKADESRRILAEEESDSSISESATPSAAPAPVIARGDQAASSSAGPALASTCVPQRRVPDPAPPPAVLLPDKVSRILITNSGLSPPTYSALVAAQGNAPSPRIPVSLRVVFSCCFLHPALPFLSHISRSCS
jgi:hypothetical protein